MRIFTANEIYLWKKLGKGITQYASTIASIKTADELATVDDVRAELGFPPRSDGHGNDFINAPNLTETVTITDEQVEAIKAALGDYSKLTTQELSTQILAIAQQAGISF